MGARRVCVGMFFLFLFLRMYMGVSVANMVGDYNYTHMAFFPFETFSRAHEKMALWAMIETPHAVINIKVCPPIGLA